MSDDRPRRPMSLLMAMALAAGPLAGGSLIPPRIPGAALAPIQPRPPLDPAKRAARKARKAARKKNR